MTRLQFSRCSKSLTEERSGRMTALSDLILFFACPLLGMTSALFLDRLASGAGEDAGGGRRGGRYHGPVPGAQRGRLGAPVPQTKGRKRCNLAGENERETCCKTSCL